MRKLMLPIAAAAALVALPAPVASAETTYCDVMNRLVPMYCEEPGPVVTIDECELREKLGMSSPMPCQWPPDPEA